MMRNAKRKLWAKYEADPGQSESSRIRGSADPVPPASQETNIWIVNHFLDSVLQWNPAG